MHEEKNVNQLPLYRRSIQLVDESGPFLIEIELASVDGRVACVGFEIRSYARNEDEVMEHANVGLPPLEDAEATITASLLRRVKVGSAVASAVQDLRSRAERAQQTSDAVPDSYNDWLIDMTGSADHASDWLKRQFELEKEFYAHAAERGSWAVMQSTHEGRGPGRPPISDEKLLRVADLYNQAYKSGDAAPVKAVARNLGEPAKRVKGWVRKARKKGFLPQTMPGTARGGTGKQEDQP
jgi:hypothetical protein